MTELEKAHEALRRVKYEAKSLADAQVIALEALTQALAPTERKGEPVGEVLSYKPMEHTAVIKWYRALNGVPPVGFDVGAKLYTSPQVPEGLQWFTVAEDGLPDFGEEVIGGHWYADPWLVPEKATRFLWGLCRVFEDDHRDFKDGKRWYTFGPSHNEITHWARINLPAIDAARKGE